MVKLIIVDKGANLKCSDIKNFDIDTLYKKCNLRKKDHFDKRHSWKLDNEHYVTLFSKDKGRANSENKYDLPQPIDNNLYFGSILLVKHQDKELTNEKVEDLSLEEWNKLYEKLFGGFEDLGEEDSYSDEEEIPEHLQTKQGYSKEGGFVVSDDDIEDEDYELPIQVNGKLKGLISIKKEEKEEILIKKAKSLSSVNRALDQKTIIKTIYIPKKILNIVVK